MAVVTGVVLPNDGDRIKAINYNDPINKILAQVNGNLDDSNITSVSGTKIGVGTIPYSALNTAAQAQVINPWIDLGITPSAVTYNGNHSYDLTVGTDKTATLSAGMRLRTTRTVAAPTQCTTLNGTTQYYSKASPAAMTFTNNWVASAWIKLTSYPAAGTVGEIMGRSDGTSGWTFWIDEFGRVCLNGRNGGAVNYRRVTSWQSVPLNRWVHVAAQEDMATNTATTTTCFVMMDGLDVPAFVSTSGTNPTALIQAGNFTIGAEAAGSAGTFFPGKIAQVAVYNTKITQATIRASISQGLLGTETALISAYSFNNAITDLNTTNANNLTAVASAVATTADSPFGYQASGSISSTLDYAIIQKITSTTITVQTPEGGAIPTSGGVSAIAYAHHRSPYGFPGQRGKWTINCQYRTQTTQSSAVASTWYNIAFQQLTIPVGEWIAGYSTSPISTATTSTILYQTLSTANNTAGDTEFVTQSYLGTSATFGAPRYVRRPLSISAAAPYYLNCAQLSGTTVTIYNLDSTVAVPPSMIEIENAYL